MSDREAASRLHSFWWSLQGLMFGVLLVFIALINLDLANLHIGFALLPVIGIFFWPLKASYSWSLFCIFLLGLFHDVASNGPLGIWALTYVLTFVVLGGGVNLKRGLGRNLGGFILVLTLVVSLAFVFGFFSIGKAPNLFSFAMSTVTAIIAFPFIYWLRNILGFARSGANPLSEAGHYGRA